MAFSLPLTWFVFFVLTVRFACEAIPVEDYPPTPALFSLLPLALSTTLSALASSASCDGAPSSKIPNPLSARSGPENPGIKHLQPILQFAGSEMAEHPQQQFRNLTYSS